MAVSFIVWLDLGVIPAKNQREEKASDKYRRAGRDDPIQFLALLGEYLTRWHRQKIVTNSESIAPTRSVGIDEKLNHEL